MSDRITHAAITGIAALLALTAVLQNATASAQEAIMLESHGFVRMIQPDEVRQLQAQQPQQATVSEEKRHASAF